MSNLLYCRILETLTQSDTISCTYGNHASMYSNKHCKYRGYPNKARSSSTAGSYGLAVPVLSSRYSLKKPGKMEILKSVTH